MNTTRSLKHYFTAFMPPHFLTALIFMSVFLAGMNGRKNSSSNVNSPVKAQAASAGASAAPSSPQKTVITKPAKLPPPLSTMIPVKTIHVVAPAFFGDDLLTRGSAVEFLFPAKEGQ